MTLPGGNLYNLARKVIGGTPYTYFAETGRALNARGDYVTTYAAGVALIDSIQAISPVLYATLGLDQSRMYIMIYTSNPLLVIERGTSGDQIEFNGDRYQLQDHTAWNPIDGWRGVLAVRLTPTVDA